jgi:hypothetical protein
MDLWLFRPQIREDRSPPAAPHLHGRGSRKCPRLISKPRSSWQTCKVGQRIAAGSSWIVGVVGTAEHRSMNDQRLASLKIALSVLSAVEPYASRGARTVPGGEPTARWAPTRSVCGLARERFLIRHCHAGYDFASAPSLNIRPKCAMIMWPHAA